MESSERPTGSAAQSYAAERSKVTIFSLGRGMMWNLWRNMQVKQKLKEGFIDY